MTIIKCRSCGADIHFIKTTAGKQMPCDRTAFIVEEDPASREVFVTAEGVIIHGHVRDAAPGEPAHIAYRSHFATCPHAAEHRKAR